MKVGQRFNINLTSSPGGPIRRSTPVLNCSLVLELEHRYQVVDVSGRLQTAESPPANAVPGMSAEQLEREMYHAGVVQTIVAPPASPEHEYLRHNNAVARKSVNRPFTAFARIQGSRVPEGGAAVRVREALRGSTAESTTPADIRQYGYDDRFHGFVIDPARDGVPDDEMLAALADADLPVLVRGGEGFPPAQIAETLLDRAFPLIIGHFGGYPMRRSLMHEMLDLLETTDNCYLETSHVRYRSVLERALLEYPDRILFGSGTPFNHPSVGIMEILTLDVSEDKLHRVFDTNPRRVIPSLNST